MSERNYYVISDDNCKFKGMTKEQILAAITQAVEGHEIGDVDTGFVTVLKEQNANNGLRFWIGTTAQYNALEEKERNCLYILTDETPAEVYAEEFAEFNAQIEAITARVVALEQETEELDERVVPLEAQAAKKGVVLHNGSVSYNAEISPKIEIGDIRGYTLVDVQHQLCHVPCVVNLGTSDFRITGSATGILSSDTSALVACVNVHGVIQNGRCYLDANKSTVFKYIGGGSTPGIQGQQITKIIGIM